MMPVEVGGGSSGSMKMGRRTGKEEGLSSGGAELVRQKEKPYQDSEPQEGGVDRDEGVIRADEGVDSNVFSGFNSANGGSGVAVQSKEDQPAEGRGEDTPASSTYKSITPPPAPGSAAPSKPKFTSRNLNATLKPTLGASQKEKTVTKFTESGKVVGRLVVLAHKRTGEDNGASPLLSAMEASTTAPLSSSNGGGATMLESLEGKTQTSAESSGVLYPPSGLATGNDDSTGGTAVPSWGSRVETSERRSMESSKKMAWGAAVMGKKEEKHLNDGGVEGGVHPNQHVTHNKRDPYPYPRRVGQSHHSEGGLGPSQSPSYSAGANSMPSSFMDVSRQQQQPYNFQGGCKSSNFDRDNAAYPHGGGGGRGIGGYPPSGRWDRSGGGGGGGGPRGGDYQNENQYRTDRHGSYDEGSREMKDRYARTGGVDGVGGGGGGTWRERGSPISNADTVMNWRSSSSRGFGRDLGEGRGDREREQYSDMHHQQNRFGAPLVNYRNSGEQGRGGRDGGVNRGGGETDHLSPDKYDQPPGVKHRPPLSPYHGGSSDGAAALLSARPDSRSPGNGDHMHSKQQQVHETSPASVQASMPSHSSSPPTSAADDSLGFVLGADPYASPRTVPSCHTNINHFPGDSMSLGNPATRGHSSSAKDQRQKGGGPLRNNSTMPAAAAMAAGMPPGAQYQQHQLHGRPVGWHPGGVEHQCMAGHHHQPLQEGGRPRHNYHVSPGAWGSKSTSILSAGVHNHMGPGKEMGRAMEPSVGPSVPKQLYDPNTNQMVEAPRKRTHDMGTPHSRPQQAPEQPNAAVPSLTKKQQLPPGAAAVPESRSAVLQRQPPATIMRREHHKDKETSDSHTGTGLLGPPMPSPSPPPRQGHHSLMNVKEAITAASSPHVKYDKMPGVVGATSLVAAALNSCSNMKSESVVNMQRESFSHKGDERPHVMRKKGGGGGGGSVTELHKQHSNLEDVASRVQVGNRNQKPQQFIHEPPPAQQETIDDGGVNKSKTTMAWIVCDEAELHSRRIKRAEERRLRPPRTSGLLFARDSDGSTKCVDNIDKILSQKRSGATTSLLVNWKVIDPASQQQQQLQRHPFSHDSQASVPIPCTAPMPPHQSGNNPWTKNLESAAPSKRKAPVHGGSSTNTPPPLVTKKVESDSLETGWFGTEIENETGDGGEWTGGGDTTTNNNNNEGNDLLPEVSPSLSLPPKPPPVVASGSISSGGGRGSGGISSRGGSSRRGKKGWGGGDRRKGGGSIHISDGSSGEPNRGLDRSTQFHQTQVHVQSKGGGGGGSMNSKTPPTHESQNQKDKIPQVSSEVNSRGGRKPRTSRRPSRGGKTGGYKQVSERSDNSKRDNNSVATSAAAWKGNSGPSQVATTISNIPT